MPIYNYKDFIKILRPIPVNWPKDIEGIPFVKKSDIDISYINNGIWLISISNINKSTKKLNEKICHSFKYDKELY